MPLPELPNLSETDAGEKTRLHDPFSEMPTPIAPADSGEKTRLHDPFSQIPTPIAPADSGEKTTFRDALSPMPSLDLPPTPPPIPSEKAPGDDDTVLMPSPTPAPSAEPGHFNLVVTMPDETVETFSLEEGAQIIGRELSCDLTLPDTSISRQHARITVEADTVMLEDLGSKNATFVDGHRIMATVAIHPDSLIRFGLSIEAYLERAS